MQFQALVLHWHVLFYQLHWHQTQLVVLKYQLVPQMEQVVSQKQHAQHTTRWHAESQYQLMHKNLVSGLAQYAEQSNVRTTQQLPQMLLVTHIWLVAELQEQVVKLLWLALISQMLIYAYSIQQVIHAYGTNHQQQLLVHA